MRTCIATGEVKRTGSDEDIPSFDGLSSGA